MSRVVLNTERLTLREFTSGDAGFILRLLNEPPFIEFVGDKGVRTLDDARAYIEAVALDSYADNGYGVYLVIHTESGEPVGMCGLFKRENLDHPDLGFAFLQAYFKQGFARESALGVMRYATDVLDLPLLAAIVDPGNQRSVMLLERLGFVREGRYRPPEEDEEIDYYAWRSGV